MTEILVDGLFIKICLTDSINPKNDKREPETVTRFRF